jgi:hypothetical protein
MPRQGARDFTGLSFGSPGEESAGVLTCSFTVVLSPGAAELACVPCLGSSSLGTLAVFSNFIKALIAPQASVRFLVLLLYPANCQTD